MTDNADVVLIIPKDRCTDYNFKGIPCMKIDTGMTAEALILMISEWKVSGKPFGSVVKKEEEE